MDIHNIQFQLRSRRLDEIFDFAFYLLRYNLWNYTTLLLFPMFLFTALNLGWIYYVYYLDGELLFWSWSHLAMLLLLFGEKTVIAQLLTIYNGLYLFNHRPSRRTVFKEFFKTFIGYFWHQFIVRGVYLFVLGFSIVLPIRGLVWHFFKSEVLLLEKLDYRRASRRLSLLGRMHLERSIGFMVLESVYFLFWVLLAVFGFNQLLGMFGLTDQYWWLDASLEYGFLSPVVNLIVFPFLGLHSIAKFILYIDARADREGWDIELNLLRGVNSTLGMKKLASPSS